MNTITDREKAIALGIAVMVADAYLKAQNNFKESEHPRDDKGKFTDGTGTSSSEGNTETFTSIEEIQKKIDSVKIDFTKDNILPELNKEDLEELGIKSKPKVRLKKNIIDRNVIKHPDIKEQDVKDLICSALYNPDFISQGNKDNYYHFISRETDNKSALTLIDIEQNEDNVLDIVHYYFARKRTREIEEKKKIK